MSGALRHDHVVRGACLDMTYEWREQVYYVCVIDAECMAGVPSAIVHTAATTDARVITADISLSAHSVPNTGP